MNLTTDNARAVYMALLNYFIIESDPKYRKLCSFAKKIKAIKDIDEREALTVYFERETSRTIDYFKNPNA